MSFNNTQIKTITINMKTIWNPKTHNLVLAHDPNSVIGFGVKMVSVNDEPVIVDMSSANELLKKFRLK